MEYQNFENQSFYELPEVVLSCNFNNCIFYDAKNTTFDKCNIDFSVFNTTASFEKCNLTVCELKEGSKYILTSIITKEQWERRHRDEEV